MSRFAELYKSEVAPALMAKFGYKSPMQIPRFDKIVINVGAGDAKENSKVIDNIIDEIRSNPEIWWTVEELANMCNTSVSQFRRKFKKNTGMLPKEYIEELKLRHSADMLLASNLSVKKIAKRFGYRDPFHFSRRFKHRFGVSPEHYRSSDGSIIT